MNVRSFRLSDYLPATQLLKESLSDECCEKTLEAFARQLSLDGELVLIAEHEEASGEQAIVGLVIGTVDRNNGYYYRLAVHPDYRNRGVGKALVAGLEQKFQQRRVKNIMIAVDEHTEVVLPWFEALGYGAKDMLRSLSQLRIVAG
ncbi:GNAT family N-acetyltransferase [Paenibacillus alvei]|uniref:GNAT family N-acetyltransferase n=1 Tax=Paenibacillus alvei TaxID=44250 RepID=A0AAP6ZW45_PAEAL|nr:MULTISPECIES: GNAT family N-acetyltransferase [Paenibacillus]EJW19581.1 putative GCN5 N-acetyltransferase [Paenibacillus alvei DSM 29]MBG9735897.1 GCN5 family acetyltransferase [Paenibacillus alvei]MBG9742492.1 GCN5 family acetyltransferase [Paenibacillus alvei]MCY7485594.1 GNAT family N-acetyltransferase [Paenibacillus alvei]MCY9541400.1 GNAT family N-acetyltransferase [Paenibacillus alvei]